MLNCWKTNWSVPGARGHQFCRAPTSLSACGDATIAERVQRLPLLISKPYAIEMAAESQPDNRMAHDEAGSVSPRSCCRFREDRWRARDYLRLQEYAAAGTKLIKCPIVEVNADNPSLNSTSKELSVSLVVARSRPRLKMSPVQQRKSARLDHWFDRTALMRGPC